MSVSRQQKRPVNNRSFYSDPKGLIISLAQQQVLLVQQLAQQLQQQRLLHQQEQ